MTEIAEWIKKNNPTIQCVQETDFKYNDTGMLKTKWQKRFIMKMLIKEKHKRVWILDKVDFKAKKVTRSKEGQWVWPGWGGGVGRKCRQL